MDTRDLSRDTSGTRAYSAFLVELAGKIPAVMMPNISVLLSLLDGDVRSNFVHLVVKTQILLQ